jgi:hypothetical protein
LGERGELVKKQWLKPIAWIAGVIGFLLLAIALKLLLSPARTALLYEEWQREGVVCLHGLVVDADGRPLQGAIVPIRISSFRMLGFLDNDIHGYKDRKLETDANGRFSIQGKAGNGLYIGDIIYPELKHLYDTSGLGSRGFTYYSNGIGYRCDPESPAIFPMIRPGERPVLWPSRGGSNWTGNETIKHEPAIPKDPSVAFGDESVTPGTFKAKVPEPELELPTNWDFLTIKKEEPK